MALVISLPAVKFCVSYNLSRFALRPQVYRWDIRRLTRHRDVAHTFPELLGKRGRAWTLGSTRLFFR